jgi:hypothetical protein
MASRGPNFAAAMHGRKGRPPPPSRLKGTGLSGDYPLCVAMTLRAEHLLTLVQTHSTIDATTVHGLYASLHCIAVVALAHTPRSASCCWRDTPSPLNYNNSVTRRDSSRKCNSHTQRNQRELHNSVHGYFPFSGATYILGRIAACYSVPICCFALPKLSSKRQGGPG